MKKNKNDFPFFLNFLAMLVLNYPGKRGGADLSEENISDFILFYIHIEGEEDFGKLKAEAGAIAENKLYNLFTGKEYKSQREVELVALHILRKK